ncbi:hypothetical protein C8T65DRAFT_696369 [Cerioporus squamosus]|nr:hypothetical protein C8T65DRAFT_740807 [Cerioporus squamosus]KAI0705767.1 hypothetical protein C8T65DRAFT_696369 [Cerioporus squamosus]
MDFSSDIFLRKDAAMLHLPGIPLTDIVVVVDGPTAVEPFMLVLPIDTLARVTAPKISGWLTALSGPGIGQADMKPSHRDTLLKIVCGLRGFLESPLGVRLDTDWAEFTRLLTRAATRVGPLEPASAALEPVTSWLEHTFPATVFMPVYETYEDPALTVDNETKKVEIIATLAMMLDPRIREALQDGFATRSESPSGSTFSGSRVPDRPAVTPSSSGPSRRARKRAAQKASAAQRAAVAASDGISLPQPTSMLPESPVTPSAAPPPPSAAPPACARTPTAQVANSVITVSAPSPSTLATPIMPVHIPGTPIPVVSAPVVSTPAVPVHIPSRDVLSESEALPTLSKAAKGKRPAATVETDESGDEASDGAESDDSMPSLQTVSNSSDSEDEEYVDDDDDYYD